MPVRFLDEEEPVGVRFLDEDPGDRGGGVSTTESTEKTERSSVGVRFLDDEGPVGVRFLDEDPAAGGSPGTVRPTPTDPQSFGLEPVEPEEFGIEPERKSLGANVAQTFFKGLTEQSVDAGKYLIRLNRDLREKNLIQEKFEGLMPAGLINFRDNMEEAALGVLTDYKEKAVPLIYNPDEDFEGSFGGQVVKAAGGMAPLLVAGPAVSVAAGGGAATAAVSGMAAMQSGGGAYEEAVEAGASERDALNAAHLNALFTAVSEPALGSVGRVSRRLSKGVPAKDGIKRAVGDFVGEAVQEGSEQVFGNIVAADVVGYDEDRAKTEGVGTAALIGGILGFGANVATLPLQAASNYDFRVARDKQVNDWQDAGVEPEQLAPFAEAKSREEWQQAERSAVAGFTLRGYGVDPEISKTFERDIRKAKTPEELDAVRKDMEQYLFKHHGIMGSSFSKPASTEMPSTEVGNDSDARSQALGKGDLSALEIVEADIASRNGIATGDDTQVVGTKGQLFPAKYAVVKRSQLQASHNSDFSKNVRHPLQNTRDLGQPNEQVKMLEISNTFDERQYVTDSPSASVGPVMGARVINEEGVSELVVFGGNGRKWAIDNMSPEKQAALAEYTNSRVDRFGVPQLQNPDELMIRFMGEFDLRNEGSRGKLQQVIDALNPAPGKVQNLSEMARVDGENNFQPQSLTGLSMEISPKEAVDFVNGALSEGLIDRNLRGQAAENGEQAQGYVRSLLGSAAFKSPPLVEFMNRQDMGTIAARGLFEQAVPAVIEMRAKRLDDLADSVTRSLESVHTYLNRENNLGKALDYASRQLETDPELQVANDLAARLAELVEVGDKGKIRTESTLEAFEGFWGKVQQSMAAYESTPDLFGESRSGPEQLAAVLESGGSGQVREAGVKYSIDKSIDQMMDKTGVPDENRQQFREERRQWISRIQPERGRLDDSGNQPTSNAETGSDAGIPRAEIREAYEALNAEPGNPEAIAKIQKAFESKPSLSTVMWERVGEVSRKYESLRGYKITSPQDVMALMMPLRDPGQESIKVLFLDKKKRILRNDIVGVGLLDASLYHPREIFSNAPEETASIITVHNHPSGVVEPSREDIRATKNLAAAGELLGFEVDDHIITDDWKFFSLKESGLVQFPELKGKKPNVQRGMKQVERSVNTEPGVQSPELPEWSLVARDDLHTVGGPDTALRIFSNMRQASPDSAHIAMLNPKNRVTAIHKVSDGLNSITDTVRVMSRLAVGESAAAVIIDYPARLQDGALNFIKVAEPVFVDKLNISIQDVVYNSWDYGYTPSSAASKGYLTRPGNALKDKSFDEIQALEKVGFDQSKVENKLRESGVSDDQITDAIAVIQRDWSEASADKGRVAYAPVVPSQEGISDIYQTRRGGDAGRPLNQPVTEQEAAQQAALEDVGNFAKLESAFQYGDTISSVLPRYLNGDVMGWKVEGSRIVDSGDFAGAMMSIRNPYVENLAVAYLDAGGNVLDSRVVAVGTIASVDADPRSVLRNVPERAVSVIIGHNHPSGDPSPSQADLEITERLIQQVEAAGLELADHVITNGDTFYSVRSGDMVRLKDSSPAGWELVKRGNLPLVTTGGTLTAVARALRKTGGKRIHAIALNGDNRVVAIHRFQDKSLENYAGVKRSLIRLADNEGATSILLDVPAGGRQTVKQLKQMSKDLAGNGLVLLDASTGRSGGSLVAKGVDFSSISRKHFMRPSMAMESPKRSYETGPFEETGPVDPEVPLAIIPGWQTASKKPVKLRDWEKVRLGNLDKIKPIAMPELYKMMKEMGVNVRLKKGRANGSFQTKGGGLIILDPRIFKNPLEATRVFQHEIGHWADWMPDHNLKRGNLIGRIHSMNKFMKGQFSPGTPKDKQIRDELWELSKWWKPIDESAVSKHYLKYRKSSIELYADALSVLLNAPGELKTRAPVFYTEFFKALDKKPQVKKEFLDAWEFMNRPAVDIASARSHDVRTMMGKGAEIFERKAKEREWELKTFDGFVNRLKKQHIYEYSPAFDAAKPRRTKDGKLIPFDEDLYSLFDSHPLGDNTIHEMVGQIYKRGLKPLEEAGIDKIVLSEYLFYNRVANESLIDETGEDTGRASIANPLGITPMEAKSQLLWMRLQLGIESMTVLDHHAKYIQDRIFDVTRYAYESGVITDEKFEQLKNNRYNYATFQVLDALEDNPHISAAMKKQMGTLKEIGDTTDMTILKAMSMIRYAQYNRAKDKLISRLAQFDEAVPAKTTWNGKRMEPRPAPQGKENMAVQRKGIPSFYVVDEQLVEMFVRTPPAIWEPVLQVMNFGWNEIYYNLFIKYNAGFQFYRNLIKDFRRQHRNLPKSAGGALSAAIRLAKHNKRALRHAKDAVLGRDNDLVSEMRAVRAIGTPYDTFTKDYFTDRDDVLNKILRQYHFLPESKQPAWRKTKILNPLRMYLDWQARMGAQFELTPKIGNYKLLSERTEWSKSEIAMHVRNKTGTPPVHRKGKGKWLNVVFPFSNVAIQSYLEDFKTLSNPKTRGAAWYKWAMSGGFMTLLKVAAEEGYLGEELEKWMAGISEYNKMTYDLIPLGFTYDGGYNGVHRGKEVTDPLKHPKSFGIKVPKDETTRMLDGIMYTVLKGMHGKGADIGDLLSVGAGTLPGLHPNIQLFDAHKSYWLDKENPIDNFTGNPALDRDISNVRGVHGALGMLHYSAKKAGALNFVRYNPGADTVQEHAVTIPPVINSMFIVSNYGYREKQNEAQEVLDVRNSKLKVSMTKNAQKSLDDYNYIRSRSVVERTYLEKERFELLKFWYKQEYIPVHESASDLMEAGKEKEAKQLMKSIPADN